MHKEFKKIDNTRFSRRASLEIIDTADVSRQKQNALLRLKLVQQEIEGYDLILLQAKEAGIVIEN